MKFPDFYFQCAKYSLFETGCILSHINGSTRYATLTHIDGEIGTHQLV